MLFEQSIRGRVSMTPAGKRRPCRGLARGRMHRFVSKVSDDLRFRDVLWRSAVFSMYTAEERRRFAFPEKERRFQEDRGGLGWFSIDGHLLNAESATSRNRIGGHLGCEEALAWEGFSPLQRVLIVAIAAAAAANSKRGVEIKPAERSLDHRDRALNFMRRKLNNLWDRISSLHDQSGLRNASGCETRGQGDSDGLKNWKGKTGDTEKFPVESTTHAPCAAAILELKRRTEHMIEKEVSNVMVAFASVLEKVEALEIHGSTQEMKQNRAQGVALGDLKISVEKASAQITSLQMSLSDIWHALLPEALCAINISPSELEHYLDKAKNESSMLFPSRRFNIQAWRQWLNMQEHASEATFIPILQDETGDDAFFKMLLTATEQEERRFSDISDWSTSVTSSDHNIWPSAEADVASATGAAGKRSMDKIAASLEVQSSGFNGYSHELAMEKSLGELEIASTKVANLELQLASLKEYLKVCEEKRKDAEEKLAEAVQQGIENRLNIAAKEEEITCLWKECKQKDASLKEIKLAAQKSKVTSDKRLAVMEDICKKKNASIMRLKEDMITMEEKVSEVMRHQTPPSSNSECSLPLVISNNFLFDMDIPSSPDGPQKVSGLKTIEDQYLAANEYASSSSQGYKERQHRSSGQSSESCLSSERFRWNSTSTDRYRIHSSKVNSCQSVMSNDPLFDIYIPASPDSPCKVLCLKTTEDQDLAANEYGCSSSQGNNETRHISSGQSSTPSTTTSVRFGRNSTRTDKNGYDNSKLNSGRSSWSKNQLGKSGADASYMNENTKSGPSSPRKVKSSTSGSVLSGVDTNTNLKSKRSSSDSEGLQQKAGKNKNNKPKDITRKKRWM